METKADEIALKMSKDACRSSEMTEHYMANNKW